MASLRSEKSSPSEGRFVLSIRGTCCRAIKICAVYEPVRIQFGAHEFEAVEANELGEFPEGPGFGTGRGGGDGPAYGLNANAVLRQRSCRSIEIHLKLARFESGRPPLPENAERQLTEEFLGLFTAGSFLVDRPKTEDRNERTRKSIQPGKGQWRSIGLGTDFRPSDLGRQQGEVMA